VSEITIVKSEEDHGTSEFPRRNTSPWPAPILPTNSFEEFSGEVNEVIPTINTGSLEVNNFVFTSVAHTIEMRKPRVPVYPIHDLPPVYDKAIAA
jgi:hypothetical protein